MPSAELIPPGAPEFRALFDTFEHAVFRLETLQAYQGSRERDLLADFVAGKLRPTDRLKADWIAMIAANTEAGKAVQRVHVVREPLTDYSICGSSSLGLRTECRGRRGHPHRVSARRRVASRAAAT